MPYWDVSISHKPFQLNCNLKEYFLNSGFVFHAAELKPAFLPIWINICMSKCRRGVKLNNKNQKDNPRNAHILLCVYVLITKSLPILTLHGYVDLLYMKLGAYTSVWNGASLQRPRFFDSRVMFPYLADMSLILDQVKSFSPWIEELIDAVYASWSLQCEWGPHELHHPPLPPIFFPEREKELWVLRGISPANLYQTLITRVLRSIRTLSQILLCLHLMPCLNVSRTRHKFIESVK